MLKVEKTSNYIKHESAYIHYIILLGPHNSINTIYLSIIGRAVISINNYHAHINHMGYDIAAVQNWQYHYHQIQFIYEETKGWRS